MATGMLIGAFITGILLGFSVAWVLAMFKFHRSMVDLEGKTRGAEAVLNEFRQQIDAKDHEAMGLRNEIALEQSSKIEAVTRLEESRKSLEGERQLLDVMKKEMTDTFNALSSAALKSSSEDFIRLASERLGKVIETTKGKLGEHQVAMDGMIKPLHETLKKYEEQIRSMEEGRLKAYGSLEEQLRTLASTNESLQRETNNLVSALRKPQVRGRWGEMQLKRVAELSGMSMHCDFTEQVSVDTDKGKVRPDMVIHLPSDREIVVDSKVSLEAYLDATADQTEESRKVKLERHAQQVRTHMNRLSSKEYWSQFDKSPEFVVLFIPGESFLGAALDMDTTLIEDGIQKNVIIATPTTFIALLRAIAFGWRQEQITKNAHEVRLLGRELYERVSKMTEHLDALGNAIRRGTEAYNKTIGSLEARVLPSVRRFKDLGVEGTEIPLLKQVDNSPRKVETMAEDTDG
ncbi:MAG: DNA recombination protein RmuC [Syntrophobacterales bacterium]|jgi:DNA recombination protein RmuC|nr:DNA recombination protein RmuC [Syntrophobacterales bacterium]